MTWKKLTLLLSAHTCDLNLWSGYVTGSPALQALGFAHESLDRRKQNAKHLATLGYEFVYSNSSSSGQLRFHHLGCQRFFCIEDVK